MDESMAIGFYLRKECYIFPFCHEIPQDESCLHVEAASMDCLTCEFKVTNQERRAELVRIFNNTMPKKVSTHYRFIKTKQWREAREKIISYDGSRCIICGIEISSHHAIHHVIRFSADDDLSEKNLVTLCSECHIKLEPVYPFGMFKLGWPNLNDFTLSLVDFYEKVRSASISEMGRLALPLERQMDHLCMICWGFDQCQYGIKSIKRNEDFMNKFEESQKAKSLMIAELKSTSRNINVQGIVLEKGNPQIVKTRYGETLLSVCLLFDETGKVRLTLFGDQIQMVQKGDKIRIENGYISVYEDENNLSVPKNRGKIILQNEQ
jgi:replication factor A1